MMAPKSAFILAAGFGTRMGDLTKATPKPLLQVNGRPLIDHAIARARESGVEKIVVNLHYLGDQITRHLAGQGVVFSNEPEILDTGGGVRNALPLLGDAPFFAINSDALWTGPAPLAALKNAWDPQTMDALLLMVRREDAIAYTRPGDFFLDGDAPRRRGDHAAAPFVYTGAQIIKPEAFADAPEGAFSTNLIWDRLLAEGRLRAAVHDGGWIDVGTPEGLRLAEKALQE